MKQDNGGNMQKSEWSGSFLGHLKKQNKKTFVDIGYVEYVHQIIGLYPFTFGQRVWYNHTHRQTFTSYNLMII